MKVTLADIRRKQKEHKETLKAWRAKRAEAIALQNQFHQAEMELEAMNQKAAMATHELRQMGSEFALQIDDDFTPKLTGTELPGEYIWTPEDSHHPQAFGPAPDGYDGYNAGYIANAVPAPQWQPQYDPLYDGPQQPAMMPQVVTYPKEVGESLYGDPQSEQI